MKKVLQVMDGLGRGGAQTFIINNIEQLYQHGIICDFLIRRDNSEFNETIEKYGGKIFLTSPFPRKAIKNYCETCEFFKQHAREYSAIHVHANALLYLLPLKLAKKYNIPVRIIHSHNTKTNVPILKPIHVINKFIVKKWANKYLACGDDAGNWMFHKGSFEVINNCISEDDFLYSEENRSKVRHEYSLSEECTLIGHVGAFKAQKNHYFIIAIFKEYIKINPNSKLILLGTGILENEIKNIVDKEGLSGYVIFAGAKGEIYRYYHAMDVFLFPSLFEGLPFALIESQMSGLRAVVSDRITDECIVTELVTKKSLNDDAEEWAKVLNAISLNPTDRREYAEIVSKAGYGVKDSAKRLANIYLQR